MRIEHTVYAELKAKYEKALAFIKEIRYFRGITPATPIKAKELLKELGEAE